MHNALTFKRIEPEIIEFTARESLHLTRLAIIACALYKYEFGPRLGKADSMEERDLESGNRPDGIPEEGTIIKTYKTFKRQELRYTRNYWLIVVVVIFIVVFLYLCLSQGTAVNQHLVAELFSLSKYH